MTRVLIVRHAHAIVLGDDGIETDFERPLSELGHEQAKNLATALTERGIIPDVLVASPLVRAIQTAEPLRELLNPEMHEVVISERLSPGELRPKKLVEELRETGGQLIVIVGHNPDLSHLTAWFLGAPDESFDLKKGAAVMLAFPQGIEKGTATLEWLVTPKWYQVGVLEAS